MEIKKIKDIADEIEKELEKNFSELDLFVTNPGLELQNNLIDLFQYIVSSNAIIYASRIGFDILHNLKAEINIKNQQIEIIRKFAKRKGLTVEESKFFLELIMEFLDEFSEISIVEHMKNNPLYNPNFRTLERLYAHFFTSLYTYVDLYTMKIFQIIVPNIHGKKLVNFQTSFNSKDNPKDRLNDINQTLNLYVKKQLNKEVLSGKQWESIFDTVIEIRDAISHRDPLVTIDNFKEYFPKILEKADKEIKILFVNVNDKEKFIAKVVEPMLPGFAISILFENIMKNCYGYLSLYDNMIQKELLSND